MKNVRLAVLAITLLLSALNVLAEDNYIIDEVKVWLRTGPGYDYKNLNLLPSGTKVKVLKDDDESGWIQVLYKGDTEGWLPGNFLTSERIARDKLVDLEKDYAKLTADYRALSQDFEAIKQDKLSTDSLYADINAEKEALKAELEEIKRISSEAISINNRNIELTENNVNLSNHNDTLSAEVQRLKEDHTQYSLIFGGLLVISGLILGAFLSRRPKRSSSWS